MQYVRCIRVRRTKPFATAHGRTYAPFSYSTVEIKPAFRNIADYAIKGIVVAESLEVAKDMIRKKYETSMTWVRFVR